MMDQEVVTAALAMEARVEAVVVHIYVRYGRRLSWWVKRRAYYRCHGGSRRAYG